MANSVITKFLNKQKHLLGQTTVIVDAHSDTTYLNHKDWHTNYNINVATMHNNKVDFNAVSHPYCIELQQQIKQQLEKQ